ncbi:MAG TPA: ATP-binding protein [Dehalococcoidia bacterium]|nr:ATP-binding protein [Dehalococcoidia bacterium]
MQLSIRWRLAIIIAAAMVMTLFAILVVARIVIDDTLRDDLDASLAEDGAAIAAQALVLEGGDASASSFQRIADLYGGQSSGSALVIIREANGDVVAVTVGDAQGTPRDPTPYPLTESELAQVLTGEPVNTTLASEDGGDQRVYAERLVGSNGVVWGAVQIVGDAQYINDTVSDFQTALVVVGAIALVLSLLAGYVIARSALQPLERVIRVAREIEAEDLGRRIHAEDAPAEVQRLSDTFDAMLDRLEKAFGAQRDFMMDMSHELRTPLAALRGNIDVLLLDENLDAESRDQLQRMSREVQRMIRLTSNLLYSAHADAGREVAKAPVELDVLVLEACRQARALRPEVSLKIAEEDQVTVTGDYDLLKQVVLNLLDNALKYSPAGTTVTVYVSGDEREARVAVADQGHGISAVQLPHIFERMYRAENGQRRTTGAGLGLSISDWIARAHGGRIMVESEPGSGSTFTLVLPREAAPSRARG